MPSIARRGVPPIASTTDVESGGAARWALVSTITRPPYQVLALRRPWLLQGKMHGRPTRRRQAAARVAPWRRGATERASRRVFHPRHGAVHLRDSPVVAAERANGSGAFAGRRAIVTG